MCIICSKDYDEKTETINCWNCKYVNSIPYLPNLKSIYCSNTRITNIPPLPNLVILQCVNTKIMTLPDLPKLQKLYCSNSKIKHINGFNRLTDLVCNYTNVLSISNLPMLEYLECKKTRINTLCNLPRIRLAICDYCYSLFKLELNCIYRADYCHWLETDKETIDSLIKTQRIIKRYLNRREFIIRLILNRYLYVDLINMIIEY
jgi:hypothetical protein